MNYSIILERVNIICSVFHTSAFPQCHNFQFYLFPCLSFWILFTNYISVQHDDLKEMGNQVAYKELVGVFLETVGNIKSYLPI